MSQDESPFPLRFVLRLAALPIALVVVAAVEGRKGCHCEPGYDPGPPATTEEVQKVRDTIEADDRARREALASAKGNLFPRPDLGPCTVAFNPIAGSRKSTFASNSPTLSHYDIPRWNADAGTGSLLDHFADELLAIESIGIAYADEVASKPGPHKLRFDSDTRSGTFPRSSLERFDNVSNAHDFELVIDKEVPGKVDSDDAFTAGYLLGRFYVWSRAEKKIVCAAPILASNSETLHFREGESKLATLVASDLREQAIVQAKERLSLVGAEPRTLVDDEPEPGDARSPQGDAGKRDAGGRTDAGSHAGDAGARTAPKVPPPF